MRRITVSTRRLVLRPLRTRDYDVWFDAHVNCGAARNRWDRGPRNKEDCSRISFRKLIKRHQSLAQKDDYYHYAVFEKKTGALVGSVDFDVFVRDTHQFANFGYVLHNPHWGKGYGREAARAGLRIGFQQLRLNRLEAAINFDNKKSIALARAIGMRREGIKRRYWFEHGEWVDHLIYVANPEEIGLRAHKPF